MRLLLLLVAIYSLIFYQHYKLSRSKTQLPGVKVISSREVSPQFSVSQRQENRVAPEFFTAGHPLEYENNQWKPQMVSFTLSNRNR